MGTEPEIVDELNTRPSLGQQLQVGRERMGMSVADVSSRLKLSVRIIRGLERDDGDGLDDNVFLRGYVSSYARLVGLSAGAIRDVVRESTAPAPLVATGTVPRSRYLLDRWSVSATYLILTGLIVGPSVWLAMTHGGIEHSLVRALPLDRAAQTVAVEATDTQIAAAADSGGDAPPSTQTPILANNRADNESTTPVKASLAPFVTTFSPEIAASAVATDEHSATVSTSDASWIEVLKPDGTRLEYGVLPADTQRSYSSDTPLTIRIGNVAGTRLVVDGDAVELTPLARGNVAHLRLFGDETTIERIEP